MINPRFEPSYYGIDFALPIMRKRYVSAPGALPAIAALVPANCTVEIVDENVEDIDWDDLRRFDVIGVTGMIVQHDRMIEILKRLQAYDAIVALGGPYVSVAEDRFDGLSDVRFIGEAEETWPAFLRALSAGEPYAERYVQAERTDMSTVPTPRYDLLKLDRYLFVAAQFSRGCPFQCEFCDIITIFGRRPRLKTPDQFIAEIDRLYALGVRTVFLVDDNFIGNKKMARHLLVRLIEWQRERNSPMNFSTEASVNIADDAEFMGLMVDANFRSVFIGLESPRPDSLNETRKYQNTRGDSLADKIARVRDCGLVIHAGFIVGFDGDDERIFDEQYAFIQETGIGQAAVAVLTPIPTTPLFDRLAAEGRLDPTNPDVPFVPLQMTQTRLRAGQRDLLLRLYEPEAYFERIFRGFRASPHFRRRRRVRDAQRSESFVASLRRWVGALILTQRLGRELARRSLLRRLAPAYVKAYAGHVAELRFEAIPFDQFVSLCLYHWHYYNLVRLSRTVEFGNPMRPAPEELAVS